MKELKMQKGITLIALIITIIVLMLLAAVAIGSLQDDGIIGKAEEARDKYQNAQTDEQSVLDGYLEKIEESLIEEKISIQTNCAKYYADVDGDKEPDGVIYIDKANTKSSSWIGYSYTITNVTTGLKEYYISKESHTTKLGTAPVLSLVPGSKGEERFYVMALEDIKRTIDGTEYAAFFWYYNVGEDGISDWDALTDTEVGKGKINTEKMMGAYGATDRPAINTRDVWNIIDTEYEAGWYIPSKEEWKAFASTFNVTSENHENLGLTGSYWSSSLDSSSSAWDVVFSLGMMGIYHFGGTDYVRLGTTF